MSGRPDMINAFGLGATSVVGRDEKEDGGRAALQWLIANTKSDDSICAEASALGARDNDPWRKLGETVVIDVEGSSVKHTVDFGPGPDYKIVRWRIDDGTT